MDWRRSKSLVLLATVLLVVVSLGGPPVVVQAADGADPQHAFSAEEMDKLCRKFEEGGLSYRDLGEEAGHYSDLACHLDAASMPSYRSLVVIKLFEGKEAARNAWSQKNMTDVEHLVVSDDVQLGLGHNYRVTLLHANSHVDITITNAPKASLELLKSMKGTAIAIVDNRKPKREFKVAVELSMIPLVAKVSVTDAAGKPVANQRVKVQLMDAARQKLGLANPGYFEVLLQSRSPSRQLVHAGDPAYDVSPQPLQLLHPDPSKHSAANSDGRHFLTDAKGEVLVRLDRFLGVGLEAEAVPWFSSIGVRLFGIFVGAGVRVGLTLRAFAVEPDENGYDVSLGDAEATLLIDRIAQLKAVEPNAVGLKSTMVKLRRSGQPISATLSTEQVRQAPPALHVGDQIEIDPQDLITIEWSAPLAVSIALKDKDADPEWITIETGGFSESAWGTQVRGAETFGLVVAGASLSVFVKSVLVPEGVSKVFTVAGALLGGIIYFFADKINPLQVTYRSQVLMDVDEDVSLYVLEGTPELATGPDTAVELTAGQMTSVRADGTIEPPSPFSIEELDESLLAAMGSPPGSDPTPGIDTEAEPTATPTPEPPVLEAARDLWIAEGGMVTRVDHLTGEVVERWDVSHPDCPSAHGGWVYVQSDGEAVWLTVADAEWETPVLECLIRLPLDGSSALEAYPVPTGHTPTFINGAATQGGDLWAITWQKTDPEGTLTYYDDWSLARLDRWAGSLVEVLPRVVALAPSEAGLVVLYSEKGAGDGAGRPLRLGIVEPGGASLREIPVDVALPRTEQGTYVTPHLRLSAGLEGLVALYDEDAGRDIIILDPASGAVIGRVTPPEGATLLLSVWPVSDGVWMSGLLEGMDDFVRYVSFDGWASLDVDPCTGVAGDCFAQVETASDAGAWASAWPYDDAFETDLDDVVMRRFDDSGQELAEAAGSELFGTG